MSDQEWAKVGALAEAVSAPVYVFVGPPRRPLATGFEANQWMRVYGNRHHDEPYLFCVCEQCGKIGIEWSGYADRIKCDAPDCRDRIARGRECVDSSYHPTLLAAYREAENYQF